MSLLPDHLHYADDRFRRLVHRTAPLERIAGGFTWVEGPVWFGDHGCLLFSDIPSERVMRWSEADGVSLFRGASGFANGHTRDRQGRLVSCRHGSRDVARTEPDGRITVLADSHGGRRLNSPNDLVVASDGAVWFTDPTYGILSSFEGYRAEPEQPGRHVYRIAPDGAVEAMITDFTQPNGLAFSPDESLLYVAESGRSHDPSVAPVIRRFRMTAAGPVDDGIACEVDAGFPDGFRVDAEGNLWTSALDGVQCFAPDGDLLGKVLVPERVSNLAFGGPRGRTLFITATTGVYRLFVDAQGAEPWCRGARP
ncbi:SMP-30/gluconolactonase/LRE family protein [Mangrovicoccus algicola]|uniref:SMP-30/gluconolactonase/LRE family protein n=1 Tax=Mangrovicoccus algicola TaxID=2771008 RepID=A0A8J6YSA0_9RHOB|nr:SMP-30/gluconolactonase/LRE family protein [Mangrovicoccus algicola]MBE3636752.1 SMP-30/gluconolactonase/LRE family protein [Mangrovicoccus algicola]